ncbi:MAG: NADH-quinone oxidoreductase subunit D [Firmicutes bacterium]|nr:NADH-quinone oxidoreductase subunit D [Bacillota bacterium]
MSKGDRENDLELNPFSSPDGENETDVDEFLPNTEEADDYVDVSEEDDPDEDETDLLYAALDIESETDEGDQELDFSSATSPVELLIEQGAVLRLPEDAALDALDPDESEASFGEDETMIINLGPQHPSTHGVLRVMLELEGETVLRSKPVIGYLHTGMEKTAEELTYVQGATNVTRMDYLSPLNNELVWSLAVESLLDVEMPPRATWIRMLMSELNRISSHVMWAATNGMDLASTTMMIFGFREREMVLSFFEKTTGLRMNHNYIRPGGVAADLPDGWEDDVEVIIDTISSRLDDYDELLTGQPIFRQRTEGVGVMSADLALALSATGPVLRAAGVPWDLRKDMPYLAYEDVDFDVVVGTVGDTFDRYAVRLNEIRESIKIVRQILEKMPSGDYRVQDAKITPPPRQRIDQSMEALIHHFKLFTRGFETLVGESYVAIESPRGELGCYLVSDGSNKPYRMHIRGPSFVNLQSVPALLRGSLLADTIAILSSVDPVLGEVDR